MKIDGFIKKSGFKIKRSDKLIVAKKGDWQKLGYIFTHLAIIIISVGGILDGNMKFKFQQALGLKQIESRNLKFSEVPKESQLNTDNFSYRATLLLNENEKNNKALVRIKDGYLVQHLPFEVKLDKFHIEHYSTGQPKSFLSDLKIMKDGKEISLHGIALLLNRNVGHLMTNPAIILKDGSEIPEGIMDAFIATLCAIHDFQIKNNSRTGRKF